MTYIIPDIHGCIRETKALIEKLNIPKGAQVICLGDLIDKGPDSAGVVKFFREWSKDYDWTLVQGNHEEMYLRWLTRSEENRLKIKRHADFVDLDSKLSDEDRDFLKKSVLYKQFSKGDKRFICVHAGIPASVIERGPLPNDPSEIAALNSRWRKRFQIMLRLRYQNPAGKMVSLGNETPQDRFWATQYKGEFGFCFFGHEPFTNEGLKNFDHALGLDGGVPFGGRLNAAIINDAGAIELTSVKSFEKYSEPLY